MRLQLRKDHDKLPYSCNVLKNIDMKLEQCIDSVNRI